MNCSKIHSQAKLSERLFRKLLVRVGRVTDIGDGGPDLLQGACPDCRSNLAIEVPS